MKTKKVPKNIEGMIKKAAQEGRISYCSADRVKQYGSFVQEFIKDVFDINATFVSDQSSIWDFAGREVVEKDAVYRKIKNTYGVDVKPLHFIPDILDKITQYQKEPPDAHDSA